jgi:hypothetical protein
MSWLIDALTAIACHFLYWLDYYRRVWHLYAAFREQPRNVGFVKRKHHIAIAQQNPHCPRTI